METVIAPEMREYQDEIRRNARWNFAANMLDLTFYNLSVSFIFGTTILSLYASYLTDSAVLIGLIPAIQNVGYFLPQLLMAQYCEQLVRKKPFVVKVSVMERLPYLFIALGIFLWADAPHWVAYAILAVGMAVATGSGGLGGPAWNAMLAKVISPSRRGRLFGLSSALGGLLGVGGAAISRQVLADNAYPISFGICFMLAFGSHVLSWICLTLNREPPLAPTKAPISMGAYWRRLPRVLRENTNFARYLVGRSLLTLGYMGTTFYIIYARQRFQVDDSFAANLTMAALISQTLSTPLLGWLADHWGHKLLTELTTVIGLLGVLLIVVAPGPTWLYGVFMLVNAAGAGLMIASMSIVMEFSSPEEVPTFSALANTILALPVLVAPLLGGWLVQGLGYGALFGAAIVFLCAGLALLHFGVREPRLVRAEQVAAAAQAAGETVDA